MQMKGLARRGSGWGAYRPSKLRLVQRCMHATAHNEQHLHSRTGDTRALRRRFPSHLSGLESPPAYLWLAGVFFPAYFPVFVSGDLLLLHSFPHHRRARLGLQ